MKQAELTAFLNAKLNLNGFPSDPSNNGLQIEGSSEVTKIAFGVDASLEMVERAAEIGAEYVFVHHGLSWGGEPRRFTGITGGRFRKFFQNNISLYAAHLPLDAHPGFGHNIELARFAGLNNVTPFCSYHGMDIGYCGELSEVADVGTIAERVCSKLISPAELKIFGEAKREILRIGVVSGGGGFEAVSAAIESNIDLLIIGEVTHEIYTTIMESGISVMRLGHYASETPGVEAVRQLVLRELNIPGVFVDLPTGL